MQQPVLPPFWLAGDSYSLYAQVELAANRKFERFFLMAAERPDGRVDAQVVVVERSGRRLRLVNDREKAAAFARQWPGYPVRYTEIRLAEQTGRHLRRVRARFQVGQGDEVTLVLACLRKGRPRAGMLSYPGGQGGGFGLEMGLSLASRRLQPGSYALINGRRCALAVGKSRWLRRPLIRGLVSDLLLRLGVGYPPAQLGAPVCQGETVRWPLPSGRQLCLTAQKEDKPQGGQTYLLEGRADFPPQQMTVVALQQGGDGLLRLQAGQVWAEFSPAWPLQGGQASSEVKLWLGQGQHRPLGAFLERKQTPQGSQVLFTLQGEGRRLRMAYRQQMQQGLWCCEVDYNRL